MPSDDASHSVNDPAEPKKTLPALDFSTFVLSLGSSCLVNLGRLAGPDGETGSPNLAAAKQIIDIMGLLSDKTKGNLDDSEAKLLGSLLYDLRVEYVDAQKKS
jgi:hypothetical protein